MSLETFVKILASVMAVAFVGGVVVLAFTYRRLKKIRVPEDADFWTVIRAVPLALVVGLDLLDLGLDSFAAPINWFVLNRLGLQALRNVATFEALIPFTGAIPTLTLAWIAARILNLGEKPDPSLLSTKKVGPGRWEVRP